MADSKISALPASTVPLAGTEVLPIVQSSTTKQVSVANLTAGRAISATEITASTGNFIIGTADKGIDFSVNAGAAGMTSELFNDYEEGTWTPSLGGTATYLAQAGRYTKIGRIVSFQGIVYVNLIGTGSTTQISGLPFAIAAGLGGAVCDVAAYGGIATAVSSLNLNINTTILYCQSNVIAATSNQTANAVFANSTYFEFAGTYQV